MYPYIVCFCGRELGCLWDLYKAIKQDMYVEEFGDMIVDPSIIPLTDDLQIEMAPVFEALHINLDCCRARMLAQVEFTDVY